MVGFDGIDRDPQGMRDTARALVKAVETIEAEISRMTVVMNSSAAEMDDKIQEASEAFQKVRPKLQDQLDEYRELAKKLTSNADKIDEIRAKTHF